MHPLCMVSRWVKCSKPFDFRPRDLFCWISANVAGACVPSKSYCGVGGIMCETPAVFVRYCVYVFKYMNGLLYF